MIKLMVALTSTIGIEAIYLTQLESLTKIVIQVLIGFFTCYYLYTKTQKLKKS
jgi:hypothetical protein